MQEPKATADSQPAPEPPFDSHSAPLSEPLLHVGNIQGNILTGFNKDHRVMVFMRIDDAAAFRPWLASQIPFVATASEVIAFSRLFKTILSRRLQEGAVKSTWLNIAFAAEGLRLLEVPVDKFTDKSFTAGLVARSESLGDPVDAKAKGNPANWVVGGSNNPRVDLMLIVEADDRADLLSEVARIEASLLKFSGAGATVVYMDEGANLPVPLSGHEHFGFQDGVSQPGVRGLVSEDKGDLLTLRQNPLKHDQVDKNGLIVSAQGKPGQDLLWPGEFVFGYPEQNADNPPKDKKDFDGPNPHPGPMAKASADEALAEWARDGSFLVYRRLHQNVGAFHKFLHTTAANLGIGDTPHSSGPKYVGSKLVGRWPSGAPVERVPNDDIPALAKDECANNHFEFQGAGHKINPVKDPFACVDVTFHRVPNADDRGQRCPFSAHIRKAYPRDDESNDKTDHPDVDGCHSRSVLNEVNTQTHRMLRRGLPYGPVSRSTTDAPYPEDDATPRGLQFLAYQTSIEDQFEFVTRCWINNPDFKEPRVGHDPIIGQNNAAGEGRKRTFTVVDHDGKDCPVTTTEDWVIPTGGGYFFAPSLEALTKLATPGRWGGATPKDRKK